LESDERNPERDSRIARGYTVSYEHDLAFQLRLQGLPEPDIAEALDEVRAHTAASGRTAEEEFGTPTEYAAAFPVAKKRTSPGRRIVTAGSILGILYVVGALAVKPLFGIDMRDLTGGVLLWPALVLIVAGIVIGFFVDYLRPAPKSR
jgi:uncharacterized membrane-anchored protein